MAERAPVVAAGAQLHGVEHVRFHRFAAATCARLGLTAEARRHRFRAEEAAIDAARDTDQEDHHDR